LPEILDEPHLDHLARLMPEPGFNDLLTEYLDGARDQLRRIQLSSASGDFAGLARDAHDLKSISGNFGARRLQRLAERLEAASKAADGPVTERVVGEINAVCDETWAALRRYLMPASGTSRWRLAASG
jgi:HPt (histidine-containing phosphotransfer) domain-containing protein